MTDARATQSFVLSKPIFCVALAIGLMPAGAARASEFCTHVNGLVRQAQSDFSELSAETSEAAWSFFLPGPRKCDVTHAPSGSKAYHCVWEFAYRAPKASDTFNAIDQSLQNCLGNRARVSTDQPVNHPDFYDLRQYQLEHANATLSIKDKSAMQRTFVFIRVHRASDDQ